MFISRYAAFKQYFRMCLIGVLGLVIQFLVYNILRRFHFPPFGASQLAVFTAIIHNFILNGRFTFQHNILKNKGYSFKRLIKFIIYSCLMIYLQSSLLQFGVVWLGSGPVRENIILAIGVGIGSLFNYLIYSRHIWPESNPPASS